MRNCNGSRQAMLYVFLLGASACMTESDAVQVQAEELTQMGAAGSNSATYAAQLDAADDDEPQKKGPRKKWWDTPPVPPCESTSWTICGEDNFGQHSQFDTCVLGFCLSCRLATDSLTCPGEWDWCDESSAPCQIPDGSWAN